MSVSKGMTLLLVHAHTHILYIMCARAACLLSSSCSQSVKDPFSPFGKRTKKCIRGFHPGCFPKASAKVRTFSEPTKRRGNFFQKNCKKDGIDDESQGKGTERGTKKQIQKDFSPIDFVRFKTTSFSQSICLTS